MIARFSRRSRGVIAAVAVATCAGLAASGQVATGATNAADPPVTETGGAYRLDGDATAKFRAAAQGGKARNVILLIGDGMGDSEITIAAPGSGVPDGGRRNG
jgi:alkaline phosphatase